MSDSFQLSLPPDFRGWNWGAPEGAPDTWLWAAQPLRQEPEGELLCPRCGEFSIEGGEDSDVFVHPDQDRYEPGNPLRTRGGYTMITMACNCGLNLALVSGNHKGAFIMRLFSVTAKGSR